jgi:hypothetical protein
VVIGDGGPNGQGDFGFTRQYGRPHTLADLYLDFLNTFVRLLYLFGDRRR